jgi:hypothetical protein
MNDVFAWVDGKSLRQALHRNGALVEEHLKVGRARRRYEGHVRHPRDEIPDTCPRSSHDGCVFALDSQSKRFLRVAERINELTRACLAGCQVKARPSLLFELQRLAILGDALVQTTDLVRRNCSRSRFESCRAGPTRNGPRRDWSGRGTGALVIGRARYAAARAQTQGERNGRYEKPDAEAHAATVAESPWAGLQLLQARLTRRVDVSVAAAATAATPEPTRAPFRDGLHVHLQARG